LECILGENAASRHDTGTPKTLRADQAQRVICGWDWSTARGRIMEKIEEQQTTNKKTIMSVFNHYKDELKIKSVKPTLSAML
jgi:hypothetical protein